MKIRKGTEVRIRRTGEIATIEEVELIRKGGKVHRYCHLKTDGGKRDLWLDAAELAGVRQQCEAVFTDRDSGRGVRLIFEADHKKGNMTAKIEDAADGSLDMEEKGLHITLATWMLETIMRHS